MGKEIDIPNRDVSINGLKGLACLVVVVALFKRVLSWTPVQWLAKYSMEIFIIHYPVQVLIAFVVSQTGVQPYEKPIFFASYIMIVLLSAIIVKRLINYLTALIVKQPRAV